MLFEYKYSGNSNVSSDSSSTGVKFVPDASRQPTFFSGRLNRHLPFREAISALHDVVISDLRFQPQDKTEYKEWAKQQEDLWVAEIMAEEPNVASQLEAKREELQQLDRQRHKVMQPFYAAQQRYFKYLYKQDYDMWFVLDPVITVHPDELFFECFSEDESTYGRLGCSHNIFDQTGEIAFGTTNVDYSAALYDEFQKIRDYKTTDFQVDPGGFDVKTQDEDDYREVKIDLPDSWVRGFLQVSSAATLPGYTFDLHPMDLHNFCFVLKRFKEKHGPRSIRFQLSPGEPVCAVFEPWGKVVKCSRSIYHGPDRAEIRVWGRRRLLVLERLIPVTRKFTVTLLGSGMPSFYVADMGEMNFTLCLSGWTANDWSRAGNFDLMAPRAEVSDEVKLKVFQTLESSWSGTPKQLATHSGLFQAEVEGALTAWVQAGRAIYDINKGVYRLRELSREPLPMDELRFSNEREQSATRLVEAGAVSKLRRTEKNGHQHLTAKVIDGNKSYSPELVIDKDQRIVGGQCDCSFFIQNKLHKGPCEHMLAMRLYANQRG